MKKILGWVMPSLIALTMLVAILAVIPLSTHAGESGVVCGVAVV